MLMRNHRTIGIMSNQGFEASHKVHRQLYLRATSHDSPGDAASCKCTHFKANYKYLLIDFINVNIAI
jgi:hypothetical protein